jgi:hypothetical protein
MGLVGVNCLQVSLEIIIRHFIPRLIVTVIWPGFLDGLTGEVDQRIEVFELEGHAAGSNIALVVPIDPQPSAYRGQQNVVMQIELPSLVQKRTLDVLLQQECPGLIAILQHLP